jgi:hypothetical protein
VPETFPPPRDDADAKAWFYLDHRRYIEVWAGLRLEAGRLFDRYLIALAPDFEQLASELDAEWDGALDMDGVSWRWLGLRRASWDHLGLQKASIGLQWYPDKLLQPGNEYEWPFLSVYVPAQGQDDQRRRSITDALAGVRSALGGRQTGDWLFWRYVQPADGAESVGPDELARSGLDGFRDLWTAAAPILDAVQAPTVAPGVADGSDHAAVPSALPAHGLGTGV